MAPSPTPTVETTIFRYFDGLSSTQRAQFQQLEPVYQAWNEKLNLISRADIAHLYLKHALHALSVAKVVTLQPGTHVLDVGTGGGFPGIPLAILFPTTQFHLIDSIGKKMRAVQHIAQELRLSNVTTAQIRAENVEGKFDFIMGRAVTRLDTFCGWVQDNIAVSAQHSIPNGILYLKGQEPLQTPWKYNSYALRDFFTEPFFATKQLVHLY